MKAISRRSKRHGLVWRRREWNLQRWLTGQPFKRPGLGNGCCGCDADNVPYFGMIGSFCRSCIERLARTRPMFTVLTVDHVRAFRHRNGVVA